MSAQFSTDLVPVSDRLEAWQFNARQICGDSRFQFPKRHPFHGSIDKRSLAGVELTRFASSPVSFAKFPVVSATSPERACIVITQLEGVRRYRQSDAVSILHPGDTTMLDSGLPWSSECPGQCARLYLRFPRWVIQNRLKINALPVLPRISGACGLGATLFRLATSLYEEAGMLTPEQGRAAVEAYLELLAGCIGHPELATQKLSHQGELYARIERVIEDRLAEPTLNPAEIADAVGISVRHLHRLFLTKGHRVGEWIRERRLERCREDLSDRRFCERNITDIAFAWGFSDSAHFSRCFKKEFGVSPRAFRSSLWTDSGPGRTFLALGSGNPPN